MCKDKFTSYMFGLELEPKHFEFLCTKTSLVFAKIESQGFFDFLKPMVINSQ